MSRSRGRVASAEQRPLYSSLNKNATSLHVHVPRQIRSASGVSTQSTVGTNIQDGLSCKSIINSNKLGEPIREKQDEIAPPTILQNRIQSPRASRLMLGSGRVRRKEHTETVELHLDTEEYINLVNSKYEDASTPIFDMKRANDPSVGTSPRNRETPIPLPKTYATRSGPLFLFSDNKVVSDHANEQTDGNHENGIEVQGHRLSPRQSMWAKHLHQKKTHVAADTRTSTAFTKKGQRGYIGLGNRAGIKNPYSWNYSVLPLKLVKLNKTDTGRPMKTLPNLSSAVLEYQDVLPTVNEKYLATIRHTRHRNSGKSGVNNSRELQKLSKWTNEWIAAQDFLLFEEYASIVNRHRLNSMANQDGRALNNRGQLQVTLPQHRPTNTPISSSTYWHPKTLSEEKQPDTLK